MFLPHFDVLCDLLLDRCTATWNLFVLYNKEINFVRILKAALFHVRRSKVEPFPISTKHEKSHLTPSMIYTKWSYHIGCYALAKNCAWFREITPLSNLTRVSLLLEWKLTAKQELNCKIYNSKRNSWKSSQFLSSDQPSEPKSLDVALNIAGVEKYARKTSDCGQPGGHWIPVLNGKER